MILDFLCKICMRRVDLNDLKNLNDPKDLNNLQAGVALNLARLMCVMYVFPILRLNDVKFVA